MYSVRSSWQNCQIRVLNSIPPIFAHSQARRSVKKLCTLPLLLMESPVRDSCHPKADNYNGAINCILQGPAFPPPIRTNPPYLHAHMTKPQVNFDWVLKIILLKKKTQTPKPQIEKYSNTLNKMGDALTSNFINQRKENSSVPDCLVSYSNISTFQTWKCF